MKGVHTMSSTHIKVTPRKLARSVAAANMRRAGVAHMNKKQRTAKGDTTSVFAENWKKWVFAFNAAKKRKPQKRRKVKAYGR